MYVFYVCFELPQINADFEMFPDNCDQLLTSWDAFYRDRIIAVGLKESESIKELIKSFENGSSECNLYKTINKP